MGWSGYDIHIHVMVDAHAGEKQIRGEKLYEEFQEQLKKLCENPRYNNDAINII